MLNKSFLSRHTPKIDVEDGRMTEKISQNSRKNRNRKSLYLKCYDDFEDSNIFLRIQRVICNKFVCNLYPKQFKANFSVKLNGNMFSFCISCDIFFQLINFPIETGLFLCKISRKIRNCAYLPS